MIKIEFDKFIGIDWSGAKGPKQPGLQVAVADAGASAPKLILPPQGKWWGRNEVLIWLSKTIKKSRVLVGFDFAFAYAHTDLGCYFPGIEMNFKNVMDLWALIEDTCHEVDNFYGGSFYKRKELPFHRYFLSPYGKGDLYLPRKRVTEFYCGKVTSPHPVMKCIGAANVGTGSLAGMRFLHRLKNNLNQKITIWPFEKKIENSVAVEIFPRLYFKQAGTNPQHWRNPETINTALEFFESKPLSEDWTPNREDEPDALLSAAALRNYASNPTIWSAPDICSSAKNYEGWIFGVK